MNKWEYKLEKEKRDAEERRRLQEEEEKKPDYTWASIAGSFAVLLLCLSALEGSEFILLGVVGIGLAVVAIVLAVFEYRSKHPKQPTTPQVSVSYQEFLELKERVIRLEALALSDMKNEKKREIFDYYFSDTEGAQ